MKLPYLINFTAYADEIHPILHMINQAYLVRRIISVTVTFIYDIEINSECSVLHYVV